MVGLFQKIVQPMLQASEDRIVARVLEALGKTPDSKPAKTASGKPQKEAPLQTQ